MKKYLKIEWPALIIGIVVFWILFFTQEFLGNFLHYGSPENRGGATNSYFLILLSTIISTLLVTLPGYLSGWFAKGRGALNALLVVVVCYLFKYCLFSTNLSEFTFSLYHLKFLSVILITPAIIGLVSGEAGQYHRNLKKRL